MDRVYIRRIVLPAHVNGLVCEDADGNYNIYINENLPDNRTASVLLHELRHCSEGHLHNDIMTALEKESAI